MNKLNCERESEREPNATVSVRAYMSERERMRVTHKNREFLVSTITLCVSMANVKMEYVYTTKLYALVKTFIRPYDENNQNQAHYLLEQFLIRHISSI